MPCITRNIDTKPCEALKILDCVLKWLRFGYGIKLQEDGGAFSASGAVGSPAVINPRTGVSVLRYKSAKYSWQIHVNS